MYDQHVPEIKEFAFQSPENMFQVFLFTICTIQQPLQRVHSLMFDIKQNGEKSAALFGFKRESYKYISEDIRRIYYTLKAFEDMGGNNTVEALFYLTEIPGLGLVKAGFVLQMLGYEIACLDRHNINKLGISESVVKLSKTIKPDTKRKKVKAYIQLCEETGGSEYYWNMWCEFVAGRRGSHLLDAETVSAYHVECIRGENHAN